MKILVESLIGSTWRSDFCISLVFMFSLPFFPFWNSTLPQFFQAIINKNLAKFGVYIWLMFSRPKARTQKHRGKCSYRCPACPATVNSKMFQPSRRAGVAGVWSSKYSVAESQTWRIFQVEIDGNSMLIDFQWFGTKYVKWIGYYSQRETSKFGKPTSGL